VVVGIVEVTALAHVAAPVAVVGDLEDVVATSLQALPTESVRITKRLLHRDKPDVYK
jgi:hypothetical protein